MNVSHLENDDYKKGINDIIEKLDLSLDPISRWEMLKLQVKDFSMHFSESLSNNAKRKIETIQKSIENIENLPSSQIHMTAKKKLEKELDELQDKDAKGAQIRSKAQLINEGERNTKFFLGLEKTNQSKNTIKCLKNSHGKYVKSNDGFFYEMCSFYENLYTSKNIDNNDKQTAACQQRTLTPPDTWSCPTLGLACVLMSRPIFPELVLSPDL